MGSNGLKDLMNQVGRRILGSLKYGHRYTDMATLNTQTPIMWISHVFHKMRLNVFAETTCG